MTIENLHCFVALAKELNFTKAAQRSHITQAAMSRKISSIEDELGIRLLDRNHHTVSLTLAGQSLFEQIQPLLEDYENTISSVQNIARGVYDSVQVLSLLHISYNKRRQLPEKMLLEYPEAS